MSNWFACIVIFTQYMHRTIMCDCTIVHIHSVLLYNKYHAILQYYTNILPADAKYVIWLHGDSIAGYYDKVWARHIAGPSSPFMDTSSADKPIHPIVFRVKIRRAYPG